MAFAYNPKNASRCVPAGDYQAVLSGVEDRVTKETNRDMLAVKWTLYMPGGSSTTFTEYIVDHPASLWRLKRIAQAMGREDQFLAGQFVLADHVGTTFRLEVEVREKAGEEQNQIKSYAVVQAATAPAKKAGKAPPVVHEPIDEDSIPF